MVDSLSGSRPTSHSNVSLIDIVNSGVEHSRSRSCSTSQKDNIIVDIVDSEVLNEVDLLCDVNSNFELLSLCQKKLGENLVFVFWPDETLSEDSLELCCTLELPKITSSIKPVMNVDVLKPQTPLNHGGYVPTTVSLTLRLGSWEKHLAGDVDYDYIIEGVTNGFRIIDEHVFPVTTTCKNYRSATLTNREASEAQIQMEIDLDRYIIAEGKPHVVSSIGAIPKSGGQSG